MGATDMAQRIPQTVIDEVRQKTNIVDLIGQYTQLVKRGKEWNGSCPFHEDRRPSLFVDEKKQVFHCFSCGRSGTIFSFLMEKENLTYPAAIESLAQAAGMPLDPRYQNQGEGPQEQRFTAIYQLYSAAQRLYQHILLNTTAGEQALDYLHEQRGVDDELIRQYGIGFVPSDNVLLSYAKEQELSPQLQNDSNLFLTNEAGQRRDRFANRIVWPIANASGQVVGFSGRALDSKNPIKYMNSPESEFFNKGQLLYNLDQVKNNIRQASTAMILEGFMDVMSVNMLDPAIGLATMGTALTNDHVRQIERLAKKVLLVYDGDQAGQNAAKRSIALINQEAPKIEVGVIVLPDNLDPDEMRLQRGLPALQNSLQQGVLTPVEFLVSAARTGRNLSNQAQYLDFLKEVMVILKQASPVEQDIQLNRLSEEFGTDKGALQQQLATTTFPKVRQETTDSGLILPPHALVEPDLNAYLPGSSISRIELAERGLIMAMIKSPAMMSYVKSQAGFAFVHSDYQLIMMLIEVYQQNVGSDFDLAKFMDFIQKPALNQKIMAIEREFGDLAVERDAVQDYLRVVMREAPYENKLNELTQAIRLAKQQHDDSKLIQLSTELINLKRQMQHDRR